MAMSGRGPLLMNHCKSLKLVSHIKLKHKSVTVVAAVTGENRRGSQRLRRMGGVAAASRRAMGCGNLKLSNALYTQIASKRMENSVAKSASP